jgi:hypothetical protein
MAKSIEASSFCFDDEKNAHSFSYIKQPYRPLNVYKALLKIALACLPEFEPRHYFRLIKALAEDNDKELARFAVVGKITSSFLNRKGIPAGFLFKKRYLPLRYHTHSFAFYYQNHILQFPLPLCDSDKIIYTSNRTQLAFCPPLFLSETEDDPHTRIEMVDLSSRDLKRDEEEVWHLTFDAKELENSVRLNPDTGEWSEADRRTMGKLMGLVLIPHGHTFPLDPNKQTLE